MQFDERHIGDYRIYAGAAEALHGDGYTAALVVERRQVGQQRSEVLLHDDRLACGHCWPSAAEALAYAIKKGRTTMRQDTVALAD